MDDFIEEDMKDGKLRIGIVGHGFVGKAVDYGFTHNNVKKFYVDPKRETTLEDLVNWEPNLVFICLPTPMNSDGTIDASLVKEAVREILMKTTAGVAIKSTVTPDILDELMTDYRGSNSVGRLVYNPEFLTEKSALDDFVNPQFHVLGGSEEATKGLQEVYDGYSLCTPARFYHMDISEASFVKYAINSFLAMKVTFFNQLFDAVDKYPNPYTSFNKIIQAVGSDDRIGHSHLKVPGFDFKKGFGGACFPKDTKAFTKFSNQLTLLEKVCIINDQYRSEYELDEREKEQNVSYGGKE